MSKDKVLLPDNHLKNAEMWVEVNMNMLDGITNNEPAKTAQSCLFINIFCSPVKMRVQTSGIMISNGNMNHNDKYE